jgi:HB1, ASXL, restriction endonuclease HTH domain
MAIARQLSNPSGPLKALLDRTRWDAKDAVSLIPPPAYPPAEPIGAQHRRAGWIVGMIEQVLADRREPMQARAIHAAVQTSLGRSVSWSSVKNALASNVGGTTPRFVRVARGRYRLRCL